MSKMFDSYSGVTPNDCLNWYYPIESSIDSSSNLKALIV